MNKIKTLFIVIIGLLVFITTQIYATDHIEVNISSSVTRKTFSDYAQTGSGGVYEIETEGDLTLSSATVRNNTATVNGGVVNNLGELTLGYNVLFSSNAANSNGGALYSVAGTTMTIKSEIQFSSNAAGSSGGAIYNQGLLNIEDNVLFSSNTASSAGGAIYTSSTTQIGDNVYFYSNKSLGSNGGAIYASSELEIGNDNLFILNQANGNGGAIYTTSTTVIGNDSSFISNVSGSSGGAIYTLGKVTIEDNVLFSSNSAISFGGAIYNGAELTINNGAKFINNISSSKGGAIYNNGILNLIADTNDILFENNISNAISNAICDNNGTINIYTGTGRIIFNDAITSENNNSILNINNSSGTLPTTGKIILNEDMTEYTGNVSIYNGTLEIGEDGTFFHCSSLMLSDGVILDFENNKIQQHVFGNLTLNSGNTVEMSIDADLSNDEIDIVIASDSSSVNGTININNINLLSDSITDNTSINFTSSTALKNQISTIEKTYSPLYVYDISYSTSTGNLNFFRSEFNPTIFETSISGLVGGYLAQTNIMSQVFANIDTKFADQQEFSKQNSNLYASTADTIFEIENKIGSNLWLKPYSVTETVDIDGMIVDNNSYGALAGLDFEVTENRMVSVYGGYIGSKQEYENITMNQIGYIVGATGMILEENFYIALTANMGFTDTDAENILSKDKFAMEMYSAGLKTGYDLEISNMFIIQPNLFLMYGSVQIDKTITSYGAELKSEDLNNFHVEPSIKMKFPLGEGWQPYGLASVVYNTAKISTVADDLSLKDVGISTYSEYGIGLEKTDIGNWSIYAQAIQRSGSREGSFLSACLKYSF